MQSLSAQPKENLYDDPAILDQYNHLIHIDNEASLRKSIPVAPSIQVAGMLKYAKSCVGKDLSKIYAPVVVNEPCSTL